MLPVSASTLYTLHCAFGAHFMREYIKNVNCTLSNRKFLLPLHTHLKNSIMKKISTLLFLLLFCSSFASAVTYIYKGKSTYSSDILFTWDGKYLYNGKSTYSSDVILTFDGSYIYNGKSTYSSDIVCTWDGRYIYEGKSLYSSDIVLTWDGSFVYKGKSTYSSDILYTYDRKYAYKGRSSYTSDILCTVDGHLPIAVLMIILF